VTPRIVNVSSPTLSIMAPPAMLTLTARSPQVNSMRCTAMTGGVQAVAQIDEGQRIAGQCDAGAIDEGADYPDCVHFFAPYHSFPWRRSLVSSQDSSSQPSP